MQNRTQANLHESTIYTAVADMFALFFSNPQKPEDTVIASTGFLLRLSVDTIDRIDENTKEWANDTDSKLEFQKRCLERDVEDHRNFLHLICRKSRELSANDNPKLLNVIQRTCSILKENLGENDEKKGSLSKKEQALVQVTLKGFNPLHYA